MDLEKIIDVRTFVSPQGYEDDIRIKGFVETGSLIYKDYVKILQKINRAILRSAEIQEIRTVMSYHKGE